MACDDGRCDVQLSMLSVLDDNVSREEVSSCFVGWMFSRFVG